MFAKYRDGKEAHTQFASEIGGRLRAQHADVPETKRSVGFAGTHAVRGAGAGRGFAVGGADGAGVREQAAGYDGRILERL